MHAVGHHLQVYALKMHKDGDECDAFARSSFNRYYYATFLAARDVVSKLDSSWSSLPHSNYPEVLEGQISTRIKIGLRRARRLGDKRLELDCRNASKAALALAKLMRESFSVRVVADYEPDIKITFGNSDRFKLAGIDITAAHQWEGQAKVYGASIASTWVQINV